MKILKLLPLPHVMFLLCAFMFYLGLPRNLAVSPKVHVVEIRQMKFNPAVLEVNKGDTVVFYKQGCGNT